MHASDLLQYGLYLVLLFALTPLLGRYMANVFQGGRNWLTPVFSPVEKGVYRLCGVDPKREQNWVDFTIALLVFDLVSVVSLYAILRLQDHLPLNPAGLPAVSPHLAFNTAISFMTNTNWQSYGGESTLSYFSQMIGLTVQNFVSPAVGFCVALALIRGLVRRESASVGNFYVDLTRGVLYVLLPLALILALLLVWQGVPQNFSDYVSAHTLEGADQTIAQGPVASQIAIKQLGTNGGGFFNANSAHPYENPTPLTNFAEMLSILLIPAAFVYSFGVMVEDRRQGRAIYAAMMLLFLGSLAISSWAEFHPNPLLAQLPVDMAGGNLEGKEMRLGIGNSVLWSVATTSASNGSVNAMHDSLTPLSGMVAVFDIMLGEIIFGGVGAGLYGMLVYVLVSLFIAGLMVGRTPEYLGKKIEGYEVKLLVLSMVLLAASILVPTAIAVVSPAGLAGLLNAGPHGFTEVLYAFSSATGNNGSAFAGLTANAWFYDVALGISLLLGRFSVILPLLAVAGSMAAKKSSPPSAGTFPTHGPMFVMLLIGVALIVGGLTHFPALALGPIVEHFALAAGQTW